MRPYFATDYLAKLFNVSAAAIRHTVKKPGFPGNAVKADPKDRRKKLYHAPTVAAQCKRADTSRLQELVQLGYDIGLLPGHDEQAVLDRPVEADDQSYGSLQRKKMLHDARKAKVEADKAEGSVVEIELVNRINAEAFQIVQDSVTQLPERLAADLAAQDDPKQIQTILECEIRRSLTDAGKRVLDPAKYR